METLDPRWRAKPRESVRESSSAGASCTSRMKRLVAPLSRVLKKTVHTGDSVTLECQAGSAAEITAAEWRKTDQKKQEEPVFLSVDGHFKSDVQHPSFKNQVEPRDGEMKSDDLSVILKNVKKEDSGTYECRFKAAGEDRRKRAIIGKEPICTIRLEVVDPGEMAKQDEAEAPPDGPAGRGHAAVFAHWWLFLLLLVLL